MNRGTFTHNNKVEIIEIQTEASASPTFNGTITTNGTSRTSWDFDDGSASFIATNSYSKSYPDATLKTVKWRFGDFKNVTACQFALNAITGTLDLSSLSNLGGNFFVYTNPNLTSIINPTNSQVFSSYLAYSCNLTGTLDLSGLSGLGGDFRAYTNPLLTGITNPTSSQVFTGYQVNDCDLDYVDFTPLVNANLNGITLQLQNNDMIVDDVNHILVDLLANAVANSAGWSNVILNISGTNAAPDSTSGGYDGLAAITDLETIYGWSITTS